MEVIVGGEESAVGTAAATVHETPNDNEIKTFMPIAWAAAYGKWHSSSHDNKVPEHQFIIIEKCLGLRIMRYYCSELRKTGGRFYSHLFSLEF